MVARRTLPDLQPVLDGIGKLTAAVTRLEDRLTRGEARADETVQGLAQVQARMEALSNRMGSIAAASQENAAGLEAVTRAMDHIPAETAEKVKPTITARHWTIGGAAVIGLANWKNVAGLLAYVGQWLKGMPPPPT